jgi:hypothetical protein
VPRRVLIQRANETFDLVEVPAPDEHHLQEIMKSQSQLIPADDLGLDGDLMVVGRETGLASGFIDLRASLDSRQRKWAERANISNSS